MNEILPTLLDVVENLLFVIAAFAIGYFLARIARRLTIRLFERFKVANTLGPSIPELVGNIVYALILSLVVIFGLALVGFPAELIVLGVVGVGLIIIIALRQSMANLASTIIILIFQPFKRGELIETLDQVGQVREILLFTTVLEKADHRLVVLPNSKIQDSGIVNYTRAGIITDNIDLLVRYDADLDRVCELIGEIAAGDPRILATPPLGVYIDSLARQGVQIKVQPTVKPEHLREVRNDLQATIKKRFDAEGIKFAQ